MSRTEEAVRLTPRRQGNERTLEAELYVEAPVEAVWKALTEAEELANWFPLRSRIEPGVGGSIRLSWDDFSQDCAIEAWEPRHHLRTLWPAAHPADPAVPVAVDYYLEGRGGGTSVRLVHSGFSAGRHTCYDYDPT